MSEPTVVMALDFHDSVAVKHKTEHEEDAEQAREDAWRDAVMRQPSLPSSSHTATDE